MDQIYGSLLLVEQRFQNSSSTRKFHWARRQIPREKFFFPRPGKQGRTDKIGISRVDAEIAEVFCERERWRMVRVFGRSDADHARCVKASNW